MICGHRILVEESRKCRYDQPRNNKVYANHLMLMFLNPEPVLLASLILRNKNMCYEHTRFQVRIGSYVCGPVVTVI